MSSDNPPEAMRAAAEPDSSGDRTGVGPGTCPTMAVPISAGVAVFVDSARFDRVEAGTSYRYRSPFFVATDVFIYPRATSAEPEAQADAFLRVMELYRQQGTFAAVKLLGRGRRTVDVNGSSRVTRFEGYEVRVELTVEERELESYFAVFARGDDYLKFRVTYPPVAESRKAAEEFMRQVLDALAHRPKDCPSP